MKRPYKVHGLTNHPLYSTWMNMRRRCDYPGGPRWEHYGGRGIKVCDEWINDFPQFLKDMGEKPSPEYTLDRIDVNGNYTPENCRWATAVEQAHNQKVRVNNTSGVTGVAKGKQLGKWRAYIMDNGHLRSLGQYKSKEDAIRARRTAENALGWA